MNTIQIVEKFDATGHMTDLMNKGWTREEVIERVQGVIEFHEFTNFASVVSGLYSWNLFASYEDARTMFFGEAA